TYGTIDEGAVAQPVKPPAAAEPSFGGVEISTSATAVSSLTDAVLYLVRYPFECNEQIASRMMPIAPLPNLPPPFPPPRLPPAQAAPGLGGPRGGPLPARPPPPRGLGFLADRRRALPLPPGPWGPRPLPPEGEGLRRPRADPHRRARLPPHHREAHPTLV